MSSEVEGILIEEDWGGKGRELDQINRVHDCDTSERFPKSI